MPRVVTISGALVAAAAAAGIMLSQVDDPQAASASVTRNVAKVVRVDDGRAARGQARAVAPAPSATSAQAPAASAPSSASPSPAAPASTHPAAPASPSPSVPSVPASKVLDYQFQLQPNYYYCGPAATRIALSATGHILSFDAIAKLLHTTTSGTDSANDTTRGLNTVLGGNVYQTREIPVSPATPAQMDQLQADVVRAITGGRAVVTNIVHSVTDTSGTRHTYDGGHYVTIVGYKDDGRTVKIADPANPNGDGTYWVTTIDMANWIATHGYSY
nr:C39 family peptidase [Planosporangium thailandense]